MLLPHYHADILEAGLDEVGRGCLAGPVVAAAVILPPDYYHPQLTDSKQLSRTLREKIQFELKKEALAWAIAEVSNQQIDQINILKASFLAMHQAISQLSLMPAHLLIDGNRFTPYPFVPHTCIVKGDTKYFSIAAASVLAKTYRDELMEQLAKDYPHYGWTHNVGYPTPQHKRAIQQHGLTPYHRLSFKST